MKSNAIRMQTPSISRWPNRVKEIVNVAVNQINEIENNVIHTKVRNAIDNSRWHTVSDMDTHNDTVEI